ncbi:MAG: hypothetical protein LBI27_07830, partial [Clostridiales bacterium]|nr:hypothetical protein [Clostridiales bacterium]
MSTLKIAEEMARRIHAGQTDKQNKPYIEHLEFVANEVATQELKIIAYLHDAIEDHPGLCDYKKLREEGFSKEIIAAIESITRRSDKDSRENYWDYIRRVADNDLAIDVKLADLKHNSMHTRISNPTEKDEARWKRYGKAKKYLNDVKTFKAEGLSVDIKKPPYCYVLHRWLYGTLQDDYTKMCDAIKQILENASKSVCASAVVQGRIKNLDSFTEKCARKASKYGQQHFKMMTDLCGTRVILQTTAQVADYCELVKQYFEIDWANSEDTGTRLGKAEFGYISQHYVVSFNKDVTNILGVEINPLDFKGMKAEIQVRTFAQHISADTLHDRIYKSLVTPLKEHIRESARIDSMLENIDAILARFVDKFDRFSLNQTSYLTVSKIEEEISILEAMNYGEEHAFTRFRNALKMAEYRRSLGHYKEMQILLEPFIKEVENGKQILDETNKARLWFEYGISLLADQKIDADEWIENALNQFKHFEKDRSDKWLESRRFYVFMLLTAGTIAEDINWLERALRVD